MTDRSAPPPRSTPRPRPLLRPDACSLAARELAEPLGATAAVARSWVAIEQPGPWGRDALTESHLNSTVGADLAAKSAGSGTRLLLMRRPGRHADAHSGTGRRIYLAYTSPGATWMEQVVIADLRELLDLDFFALNAGRRPELGRSVTGPVLFVCTNARRDQCCAVLGRPVAITLSESHDDTVWESSHLGGHRFAPTSLLLPHGVSHGRLTPALGQAVIESSQMGHLVLSGYRGRSTWERPAQAAEIAVRRLSGELGLDALTASDPAPEGHNDPTRWRVDVTHRDGRRWAVDVAASPAEQARPESCGKTPGHPDGYTVLSVDPI